MKTTQNKIAIFLIAVITVIPIWFANDAHAQTSRDTTCVYTEALENLRRDVTQKEKRLQKLQELVDNLESQIEVFERLRSRDSLLLDITDQRLQVRQEKINVQSNQIKQLQQQLKRSNRTRWFYYVGGVGTVVLSSIVLNKSTN